MVQCMFFFYPWRLPKIDTTIFPNESESRFISHDHVLLVTITSTIFSQIYVGWWQIIVITLLLVRLPIKILSLRSFVLSQLLLDRNTAEE